MIVKAAIFHVTMPLHGYQKLQAIFPLLPEVLELGFHPGFTINIENYHFQVGCCRNPATVVKQNYLICEDSCYCLHYHRTHLDITNVSRPRWDPPWHSERAYLTKSFQTSTSIRRARQSDVATFNSNKRIFFMLMPRTWFKVEEFRLE